MTDTAVRDAEVPGAFPAHPLDPASAAEYLAGRDIMAAAGMLAEPVRFAYYGLEEPPKDELLGTSQSRPDGRLGAFLIDLSRGEWPTWWCRWAGARWSACAGWIRAPMASCRSSRPTSPWWRRWSARTRSGGRPWPGA